MQIFFLNFECCFTLSFSYLLSLGQKREGKSLTWSWLSPNQIDSLGRFSYSLLFQIAMVKLIISCNGVIFGKVTGNSLFWIAQIESQEYGKLPWDSIYLILNQICMRLLPSCFCTSLKDSVQPIWLIPYGETWLYPPKFWFVYYSAYPQFTCFHRPWCNFLCFISNVVK